MSKLRKTKKSPKKPNIAITLGDPSGIGPEVIAKALSKTDIQRLANFHIMGDAFIFNRFFKKKSPNCTFIDSGNIYPKTWKPGMANETSAKSSLDYLNKAIQLIKEKKISAVVTGPVSKEFIWTIDSTFSGHTEYFARAFQIKRYEMMFVGPNIRTVIVTRHMPLRSVSDAISKEKILDTITLTHDALQKLFKIKNPSIAVCGLNPHAGEGGTLGTEEIHHIIPAIEQAKQLGINVRGPFAADTLFSPDIGKQYDLIIAMYHDQGLIPVKTLAFKKLVNLTIGLPFVRTSPAHGTAFDIAGKNKADASSMCEAIKLASQLA